MAVMRQREEVEGGGAGAGAAAAGGRRVDEGAAGAMGRGGAVERGGGVAEVARQMRRVAAVGAGWARAPILRRTAAR